MKISLTWLRELCPTDLSDEEIARRLTFAGLEVEGTERREIPAGVVAGRVISKTPIAGSDHLNTCQVDDGEGTHQVVCGAANYLQGDVVPMARVGAQLAGGMLIKRAKLRGVESDGMLCSARELGLSDDHSGLLQLARDAKPGTPVGALLGLPDVVLEVNVTPNRADALSHLGVARDLSALTGVAVRLPAAAAAGQGVQPVQVDVLDGERCPRYVARIIEGVRVGPSPLLVQERLRACGVRPISNVVDATNLALLELGQPLHAFDLDQLQEGRIVVRRAQEGEKMTTLDGKERALVADDLVIADGARPIALAGVMGGQTSEVTEQTTRVLVESALFEPAGIRRTARRQALHTEASHRFERGLDEVMTAHAADRCADLIAQLAGGTVLPGRVDVFPSPRPPVAIEVRPARISAVLGAAVPPEEVERWLSALGLVPQGGSAAQRSWRVPSWRRDLRREIDCVEEIARLRGFDTIPVVTPMAGVGETAAPDPLRRATAAARAALSARGFDEVLNYSFIGERDLLALVPGGPAPAALRVANPLTVEQGALRWTLFAGLLRNLGYNLARGAADLRFYELGRIYRPERDARHAEGKLAWPVAEPRRLGLALTGNRSAKGWAGGGEPLDFFDLKGAVEDLLEAMGVADFRFEPLAHPALHPASAAALVVDGAPAGALGEVHPLVAAHFEVPAQTFLAELDWEVLLGKALAQRSLRGVPRFPAIARDLAFVVDAAVPADRLLAEIRAADSGQLLEQVSLFDVYRGAPVPEGRKSMAFGLSLRAEDRTLTDVEADALCAAVRERLKAQVGAEIRG